MPAVWTAPKTWALDELVTEDMLNEQIRDNVEYLRSPNYFRFLGAGEGNYAIAPTINVWTALSATDFTKTITTYGHRLWVGFSGMVNYNAAGTLGLSVEVDNGGGPSTIGAVDGLGTVFGSGSGHVSFVVPIPLAAGTWQVRIMARITVAGTVTVYNHPSSAGQRSSPVFWGSDGI